MCFYLVRTGILNKLKTFGASAVDLPWQKLLLCQSLLVILNRVHIQEYIPHGTLSLLQIYFYYSDDTVSVRGLIRKNVSPKCVLILHDVTQQLCLNLRSPLKLSNNGSQRKYQANCVKIIKHILADTLVDLSFHQDYHIENCLL